jgi:DNA-binding response OmpR family regulator
MPLLEPATSPASSEGVIEGAGMRFLIAHRNSSARAALAGAVPRDGHESLEILETSDGHEAVEMLLADDSPGLAVVDWDLPGVDGPEICRLVRDFHLSSPPYVVVLASSAHEDTREAFTAGADDCIRTPAPAAMIHDRLEEGLRAVRGQQARSERPSVRATLEAVCSRDSDAANFFGFSLAEHRPDLYGGSADDLRLPGAEFTKPADEPCGPAVLEAVLRQA